MYLSCYYLPMSRLKLRTCSFMVAKWEEFLPTHNVYLPNVNPFVYIHFNAKIHKGWSITLNMSNRVYLEVERILSRMEWIGGIWFWKTSIKSTLFFCNSQFLPPNTCICLLVPESKMNTEYFAESQSGETFSYNKQQGSPKSLQNNSQSAWLSG